jgi:hypothetical protein
MRPDLLRRLFLLALVAAASELVMRERRAEPVSAASLSDARDLAHSTHEAAHK